jgi:hypothetical protein
MIPFDLAVMLQKLTTVSLITVSVSVNESPLAREFGRKGLSSRLHILGTRSGV